VIHHYGVRLVASCAVTLLAVAAFCGVASANPYTCGAEITLQQLYTAGFNGNANFIEGSEQLCYITITDVSFSAGSIGTVTFTDTGDPAGFPSDLLVLRNYTLGGKTFAQICFWSDNSPIAARCPTNVNGPLNQRYDESNPGSFQLTIVFDKYPQYPITISAWSDSVESGTVSDTFTISPATPEPSSILLLGSGVLGLTGLARRKLRR
jgi:hypothetical protein